MTDLLGASSLLLTALSVLLGMWFQTLVSALAESTAQTPEGRKGQRRRLKGLIVGCAAPLAISSIAVFLVFLPDVLKVALFSLERFCALSLSQFLRTYDPIATAFVLVEVLTLVPALASLKLVRDLQRRRKEIAA